MNSSLGLDAEGEEVRWDVTVHIKFNFIVTYRSMLGFGWHALRLCEGRGQCQVDLASWYDPIMNSSFGLDAEGEEVRWDVTVRIKFDFIVTYRSMLGFGWHALRLCEGRGQC